MSRATTVDLTDELFERLARSGEVPPYLADGPVPEHRGSDTTEQADTGLGGTR
ncbi:MAG: hypothetical protein QOG82_2026 [Actinomycetota bacterium]|jgi:hypothetical protein|nr:hypothetical protein [Actinomycetota bacterium]